MNLSVKDRKRLWARAANRCSYRWNAELCAHPLVIENAGKDVVVGHECHIVGEKPTSARHRVDHPGRESYENAILLCPNHHRIVDDDENVYTTETLHKMKKDHEAALASDPDVRIAVSNSEFVTEAAEVDRAVGMEVNQPATLAGVRSILKATNVREAIGFSTNQTLTGRISSCPNCGGLVPSAHVGPLARSVSCPHCGQGMPLR